MKLGIRAKLFWISVILILLTGIPVGAYLESELRSSLEKRFEDELTHHASAARTLFEVVADVDSIDAVDRHADSLGRTLAVQVTVVSASGRVLGDSRLDVEQVRRMTRLGTRPEIVNATDLRPGVARRYSTTSRADMLYIALPFVRGDTSGFVRVAKPLDAIDAAAARLRTILVIAGLLGLGVAMIMSALAAHLSSRRVRTLVNTAHAMAGGEREARIDVDSDDELARLALSLNQMADELQQTLAARGEERDRLQAVLEGIADGVVAVDEANRVTLLNAAARRMLGEPHDAVGRPLLELIRAPAVQDLVSNLGDSAEAQIEFALPGPNARRVMAYGSPQRATGGAVIMLHDVTEVRRLETVRRDFVANVSHELRTPVSVISANAETLLGAQAIAPDKARVFIEAILRNAERLTRIIADLLDLARIEADQIVLDTEVAELGPQVRSAVDTMASRARAKDLTLQVDVPHGLRAAFDAKAFDQVLLNLLDNAVKYTPPGGHIRVAAARDGDGVRVEVADDGPGIAPRYRRRVFERFFRVDAGRSRAVGGTGLGLSIVRNLVEAMGGHVGVDPATPHGSTFWFRLPSTA